MSKINRIGNKLGLAGLAGILLSLGMVANERMTQTSVAEANHRAELQRQMSDDALKAEAETRSMEIANRGVRLARASKEFGKARSQFYASRNEQSKLLDGMLSVAADPESLETFRKIKARTEEYVAGAGELAGLARKVMELNQKRSAISGQWDKAVDEMRAALGAAEMPFQAQVLLGEADGIFSAARLETWRYFATGEFDKEKVARNAAAISDSLQRLRGLVTGKSFLQQIDALGGLMKEFLDLSNGAIEADTQKDAVSRTRTAPAVDAMAELLRTAETSAQKDVAEAKATVDDKSLHAARMSLGFGAAMILLMIGSSVFSYLGIARPITRLNGAMGRMAAGDLDVVIPGADRGDEVGDVAKTITVIRQNAEQKAHDEAEAKARQDQIAAESRKAEMSRLADHFESAVGDIVHTVSSASSELESSASTLTSSAERAQQLTGVVAAASEEASANVQSVASATEQLSSSITEISRQVQESARIADDAVSQARATTGRVSELSKAATRIGDVLELINTIAGQTNLLALNATIEAARAGEAGRGFAVVASEVKALAEQTAKATGEIGQQISGIQAATQESVGAIREISGTIEKLSEIASTIAAAVEEQGAATQEISRNVQQAAHGTQQVSANVVDVQRGAAETGSASSQVLSAAQSLSGDSDRLKTEVGRFLDSVRAA